MLKSIAEISAEHNIPLKKLKQMQADGVLIGTRDSTPREDIVATIKKGNTLSSYQRVLLMRNIDWLAGFDDAIEWYAKRQLDDLGDVAGEALSEEMRPHIIIDGVSLNRSGAADELAEKIAPLIPSEGCDYHYVAVRIIYNVPNFALALTAQRLSRCIAKARKCPALEGMSATKNRRTRFFQREHDL